MAFNPKNFFDKSKSSDSGSDQSATKDTPKPTKPSPKVTKQAAVEPKPSSSKTNKPSKPASAKKPSKKTTKPKSSVPEVQKVEFYSLPVRMLKQDGAWYFVLNDIFPIAKIPSDSNPMQKLQSKPELKDDWDDLTKQLTFIEDNKTVTQTCVDKDSLLRLIRHFDSPFPGPFAGWVTHVVKLDRVQLSPPQPPAPPQQQATSPTHPI